MQRRTAILTFFIIILLPLVCFSAEKRNDPIPVKQAQTAGIKNLLKGKIIVVDPGHGGSDPGAIGKSGLAEKDVTLAISTELRKLLEDMNANVILTRTSDRDVHSEQASDVQELKSRVNIANKARADVFVSVHIDSFTDPTARGTTTYYMPKSKADQRLANQIQQSLVNQLGLLNRGFQASEFYVLKHTTMPAILTEVAFISNPSEESLMQRTEFIKKAAYGIFSGITSFFKYTE